MLLSFNGLKTTLNKYFKNMISVSNRLPPYQAQQNVRSDLSPSKDYQQRERVD